MYVYWGRDQPRRAGVPEDNHHQPRQRSSTTMVLGTATMESFSATIDALKSRVGTSEALCLPDVVDRPALSHLCYFRFRLRPCFPNASTSSSTVRMPDSRVGSTECSKGSPASTASGTTTGGKWTLSSASVMSVWGM